MKYVDREKVLQQTAKYGDDIGLNLIFTDKDSYEKLGKYLQSDKKLLKASFYDKDTNWFDDECLNIVLNKPVHNWSDLKIYRNLQAKITSHIVNRLTGGYLQKHVVTSPEYQGYYWEIPDSHKNIGSINKTIFGYNKRYWKNQQKLYQAYLNNKEIDIRDKQIDNDLTFSIDELQELNENLVKPATENIVHLGETTNLMQKNDLNVWSFNGNDVWEAWISPNALFNMILRKTPHLHTNILGENLFYDKNKQLSWEEIVNYIHNQMKEQVLQQLKINQQKTFDSLAGAIITEDNKNVKSLFEKQKELNEIALNAYLKEKSMQATNLEQKLADLKSTKSQEINYNNSISKGR